jgi:acetyl esterase
MALKQPPPWIASRVARALTSLPPSVMVRLSGRPPIEIDGLRLEPEAQLLLALRDKLGAPRWDASMSVEHGREVTRAEALVAAGVRPVPVGAVRELRVAGAEGLLAARHYAPAEPGPRPLLVYFHGGGFVAGDLESHDEPCRMLCRHAGVHVLSVDYRLAPEHPFPAYIEDALAAFTWGAEHAAELGADPARVAVGGDSAGGNLATNVAQALRGGAGAPVLQLLIYPAVDASQARPSHELFNDGFFLTGELIDWYISHFLPPDADRTDPRRSPLLASDLSGLAPAIVVTNGFDPLRDEGEAYAAALAAARVPVVARRYSGLFHGFIHSGGVSPVCRAATAELAGMVRGRLG